MLELQPDEVVAAGLWELEAAIVPVLKLAPGAAVNAGVVSFVTRQGITHISA